MNLTFDRYELSNGINLIVKENHHAQSVVIRGYLHGGANRDPVDKEGLASFTAKAMGRGTTKRSFAEINEVVESLAAGIYVNAGRHLLGFGGKSLAEDFELLVELMTDNLLYPTFPSQEIEKLRGQIITELKEMDDDPRSLAQRHFREVLYTHEHPYGRPVEGSLRSIPQLRRDDWLNFYQGLHPQAGAVIVVGDVKSELVYQSLEQSLGQWRPSTLPPDLSLSPSRPLFEQRRKVHFMPDKSQADLILGYLGPDRLADDYYAAYVGDTILGQLGLGGRIGQSVRDSEGMAYYARSLMQAGLGPGPWFIYAGINPLAVDRAVELILAEIQKFRNSPVSDQELADAKAYLTGILPLQMETNEGVASTLMEMQIYQLSDDFITRYPDLIHRVTKEDIQAAAQKYLHEEIYALSIAGPYSDHE